MSYDDLLRNNEKYVGDIVHYKGEILQVRHDYQDIYTLRISVTEGDYGWSDPVYANYAGTRVLEDDIVEFWGAVKGVIDYTALFGQVVSIPEVDILILEQSK